jgi:hypothetical protein
MLSPVNICADNRVVYGIPYITERENKADLVLLDMQNVDTEIPQLAVHVAVGHILSGQSHRIAQY